MDASEALSCTDGSVAQKRRAFCAPVQSSVQAASQPTKKRPNLPETLTPAISATIQRRNDTEDNSLLSLPHQGRGRPTRRRGFDDDFSYDRAPSGDGPRYQAPSSSPSASFGPELDATVKWFDPDKGFGFVALADGSGDVFLHANALTNAGHSSVSPGASLRVKVGQGQKGRQVMEVLAVDESTRSQAPTRSAPTPRPPSHPGSPALQAPVERRGTVKWYNAAKGFGFVAISDSGKDVFVHASALQRSGVPQLIEGQTVWVGVVQGTKGPEAVSVRAA